MKHITNYRGRADVFSTLALAMDTRERLFPEPELMACYHGAIVQGTNCYIIEMYSGSESVGYLRENRHG